MKKPKTEYGTAAINADGESQGSEFFPNLRDAKAEALRLVNVGVSPAAIVERRTYLGSVDPGSRFEDETVMTFGCATALRAGKWSAFK
jgi:hypothetical protein